MWFFFFFRLNFFMAIWGCQLDTPGKRKVQGVASIRLEGHFPDCYLMEEGTQATVAAPPLGRWLWVVLQSRLESQGRQARKRGCSCLLPCLPWMTTVNYWSKNTLSSPKLSWATVFITSTETKLLQLQHYTGLAQSSFHERLIGTQ